MPDQWMRDAVLTEIRRASETGGRAPRGEMQETLGIGAGDLGLVLDELREAGLIREEVPGEYDLNPEAPGTEPPPAATAGEPAVASSDRAVEPNPDRRAHMQALADEEEMCMSRAMIAALDDDALGRLVKAGIEGAGGEFLLRVVA